MPGPVRVGANRRDVARERARIACGHPTLSAPRALSVRWELPIRGGAWEAARASQFRFTSHHCACNGMHHVARLRCPYQRWQGFHAGQSPVSAQDKGGLPSTPVTEPAARKAAQSPPSDCSTPHWCMGAESPHALHEGLAAAWQHVLMVSQASLHLPGRASEGCAELQARRCKRRANRWPAT